MSTQDMALPQGFTQEQMDTIKARWGQIGQSDPQQFMNEMTQYGVGTKVAAQAAGMSFNDFGQWQLANGATSGFGGYDPSKLTSDDYSSPAWLNYFGGDEGYYNPQAQWDVAAQSALQNPNVVVGGTPVGQTAIQGLGARPPNTDAQNAAMGVGSNTQAPTAWAPQGTTGGTGTQTAQDPWAPATGAVNVNTGVNPAWSQSQRQSSPTWTNGYKAPAWAAPGGNNNTTYGSSGALNSAFGQGAGGQTQPIGGALTQFLTTPHP